MINYNPTSFSRINSSINFSLRLKNSKAFKIWTKKDQFCREWNYSTTFNIIKRFLNKDPGSTELRMGSKQEGIQF